MTTQTRNRILTSIFLLILTVLVSELSYFYFNYRRRQNLNATVATPPPTTSTSLSTPTPTPIPTTSSTSTLKTTLNSLTNLASPDILPYLSQFKASYSFSGKVVKTSPLKITIRLKPNLEPLDIIVNPQTKDKLQIILPNGQTSNRPTDIPINSTITFTITKDLLHLNPSNPKLPATTFATITVTNP